MSHWIILLQSSTTRFDPNRLNISVFELYMVGHVARMGEERGVHRVVVGEPEGRRPLGRPRRRWADNIRTDLQEVECVYVDWIGLVQDRDRWRTLVSAVMNLYREMRGIS